MGRKSLELVDQLKLKGQELLVYLQDSSLRIKLKD